MKRLERDILANTSPSAVLTFAQKFLINFDIVKTDLPETKELGLSKATFKWKNLLHRLNEHWKGSKNQENNSCFPSGIQQLLRVNSYSVHAIKTNKLHPINVKMMFPLYCIFISLSFPVYSIPKFSILCMIFKSLQQFQMGTKGEAILSDWSNVVRMLINSVDIDDWKFGEICILS